MRTTSVALLTSMIAFYATVGAAQTPTYRYVTPMVEAGLGRRLRCHVVNVDRRMIWVQPTIRDVTGAPISMDDCADDHDNLLTPGTACAAWTGDTGRLGYCEVHTSSRRVRVGLELVDEQQGTRVVVLGTRR